MTKALLTSSFASSLSSDRPVIMHTKYMSFSEKRRFAILSPILSTIGHILEQLFWHKGVWKFINTWQFISPGSRYRRDFTASRLALGTPPALGIHSPNGFYKTAPITNGRDKWSLDIYSRTNIFGNAGIHNALPLLHWFKVASRMSRYELAALESYYTDAYKRSR